MATENLIFGLAERHYQDIVVIFKRYPAIKEVLIFGSRAKGLEKPSSDFDLAVLAPELSDREFSEVWVQLSELPIVFKLDIVHWDKIRNLSLKEKIMKEGKTFYKTAFS